MDRYTIVAFEDFQIDAVGGEVEVVVGDERVRMTRGEFLTLMTDVSGWAAVTNRAMLDPAPLVA